MDNRNCLLVDLQVAEANGRAEREVAVAMLDRGAPGRKRTVGADRGYDTAAFVEQCRQLNVTPHVAQCTNGGRRRSAIDARTTRQPGYEISRRIRMRIEEAFGWIKTVGNLRRSRWRGVQKTQLAAYMTASAYNILRICRLQSATA